MNPNKKSSKKKDEYECKCCDFVTSRRSQMARHETTAKHIILSNPNKILIEKVPKQKFVCQSGKIYKHLSSLCAHKKKCNCIEAEPLEDSSTTIDTLASLFQEQLKENKKLSTIVLDVVKENKELSELMKEQNKQILDLAGKIGPITNNHTTTTNNHFNLQFFLNEQCKDALNLMEFVNTIQLQLSDLDMMGKLGYTEGISKIFIRGLKELDVFKRPIHCSDLKRETMYVKDKDSWEKENSENIKLKQAIKYIEHQNIKQLPSWIKEHPAAEDTETKTHMDYIHIVHESMGGSSVEPQEKKHSKIIKNIAKEVVIDKP